MPPKHSNPCGRSISQLESRSHSMSEATKDQEADPSVVGTVHVRSIVLRHSIIIPFVIVVCSPLGKPKAPHSQTYPTDLNSAGAMMWIGLGWLILAWTLSCVDVASLQSQRVVAPKARLLCIVSGAVSTGACISWFVIFWARIL